MIDQHRTPQCIAQPNRSIDDRIIVTAQSLLQPAEDVMASLLQRLVVQVPASRSIGPVSKGWRQILGHI
jgi:hypothetical protein